MDNIHEKYGIFACRLTDPLSQIISKIMSLRDNDPNSIGFYYINDSSTYNITLLNIHDAHPIHWVTPNYTMDLLLESPFVSKIIYYPLNTSIKRITEINSILSRKSIDKHDTKLEETFKTLILSIDNDYSKDYTYLLWKLVNIDNRDNLITGYTLVNKILLKLMDTTDAISISNSNIIPCHLLKKAVSISSTHDISNQDDIDHILEQSRQEIIALATCFMELFLKNKIFHDKILLKKSLIPKNNVSHLSDLGTCIRNIVKSFDNPDNLTINIGSMIIAYNNAIRGTGLTKIAISDNPCTISRSVTITIPGDIVSVPTAMQSMQSIHIPMFHSNLKLASNSQLLDILIYIDSLRDTNGTTDTRFANIQNEITHELAHRRK